MYGRSWSIVLIMALFLAAFASASNVALIVQLPNGTTLERCVNIEEGTSGYSIFQKSGIRSKWTYTVGLGHFLSEVEQYKGSDADGYWTFFIYDKSSGAWKVSPVGSDGGSCWNGDFNSYSGHYCARNGDMIAWVRTGWDPNTWTPLEYPAEADFSSVCGLSISKTDFVVDGSKISNIEEGSRISAYPGSYMQIIVKARNQFATEDKITIRNARAYVFLEGIDDGSDLEFESEEFSIKPSSESSARINFSLPLTALEDTYNLKVYIEGEGSNGFDYKDEKQFLLKVKKSSHKLSVSLFQAERNESCPDEELVLNLKVVNVGSNDENAELTILDSQLGPLDSSKVRIPANSGSGSVYSASIPILLKGAEPGIHSISLILNYSGMQETQLTQIRVKDCNGNFTNITTQMELQNNQESSEKSSFINQEVRADRAYASSTSLSKSEISDLLVTAVLSLSIVLLVLLIIYMIRKKL
ncbi:MAG: hypothetical protein QXW00_03135 [Candidatus Woesearchaeota archaeon]